MKRKIAAAIAAVMAITALAVPSFGVSAAITTLSNYGAGTTIMENQSAYQVPPLTNGVGADHTAGTTNWATFDVSGTSAVDYGLYLPITLATPVFELTPQRFEVKLHNANWSFWNYMGGLSSNDPSYINKPGTANPQFSAGTAGYKNQFHSSTTFSGTTKYVQTATYAGSDLLLPNRSGVLWAAGGVFTGIDAAGLAALRAAIIGEIGSLTGLEIAMATATNSPAATTITAAELQTLIDATLAASPARDANNVNNVTTSATSAFAVNLAAAISTAVAAQPSATQYIAYAVGTLSELITATTFPTIVAADITNWGTATKVAQLTAAPITNPSLVAANDLALAGYNSRAGSGANTARYLSYTIEFDDLNWTHAWVTYYPGYAGANAMNGDIINLPLVITTGSTDPVTYDILNSTSSSVQDRTAQPLSVGGKGTKSTISATVEGSLALALGTLYITEKTYSSLNGARGTTYGIKLSAPSGYYFSTIPTAAQVQSNRSNIVVSGANAALAPFAYASSQEIADAGSGIRNTIIIPYQLSSLTNVTGSFIAVNGLTLMPIGEVPAYNTDIKVTVDDAGAIAASPALLNVTGTQIAITKGTDNGKVTKEDVTVGKFIRASIDFWTANTKDSTKAVPTIKAGYRNQKGIEVNFEELAPNSWWASPETTFQLTDADGKALDGVKFTSIEAAKEAGFGTSPGLTDTAAAKPNNNQHYGDVGKKYTDSYYFPAGAGAVIFRGLVQNKWGEFYANGQSKADKGKIVFTPNLSVDINFSGDIYLSVTNGTYGFNDEGYISNNRRVLIAKAEKQVEVQSSTSNVQIGSQRIDVANVTVVELAKGAIRYAVGAGYKLQFKIGEFGLPIGTGDIGFVPAGSAKVDGGDLQVDSAPGFATTSSNTFTLGTKKASSATASTLVVSGLQIKVNRAVPFGKYELWVGGSAIRDNEAKGTAVSTTASADWDNSVGQTTNDGFHNLGIQYNEYVAIKTEAANNAFANKVVITQGEDVSSILVNGEAKELGYTHPVTGEFVTAYAKTINNRLYIPIRAMADAFGAGPADISWSSVTQTATVRLNGMVVTWTLDSATYTAANGAKIGMPDNCVDTMIDDLNYISIRAFAEAFNIPLAWDTETSTATLNPAASAAVQH